MEKEQDSEILENGIVGLYLHAKSFRDEELTSDYHYQGRIIGIVNNFALIQTFSWLDGTDDIIISYPLDILLAPKNAKFYLTAEDMKSFYEKKPENV